MIAVDFSYAGHKLSDYGYIICEFDGGSGTDTSSAGAEIKFTTVAKHYGQRYSLSNAVFGTCLSTTFQICKSPDTYPDQDDMEISSADFRQLMHWLNRRSFSQLSFYDCDNNQSCYYDASFNAKAVRVSGVIVGLELSVTTNRPFGYGAEVTHTFTSSSFTVNDANDDVGYFYPNLVITCGAAGDLTLTNTTAGCSMKVKNCVRNEVITVNGDAMTISSSVATHDIANDFNYDFFKLQNTYDTKANACTVNLSSRVVIKYNPIVKEFP